MKLSTALSLLGLGLGTIAFAIPGCSSDETSTGTPASVGKVPPAPEGAATAGTEERTFALNALSLGEADRAGVKNKDAWKSYGYNLDGLITVVNDPKAADLAKVCNRASGAPATVHNDGDQGIDNAFGKEILKLLDPFAPTPSKSLTDAIVKGDFTIMLKIKGLTDDPAQTNTGLSGTLLVGGSFSESGATPTFSPTDDWPYVADPQVPITGAYINKGVFVNGAGGAKVELALSIQGQTLALTINKALITFKHNPATKELTDGVIAGVIDTAQFVEGISSVAGRFSPELCSGTTVEGIKDSIRQASDMLADGSQAAGVACTGISVGLGFTAKQVANPTKVAPESTPPPDPCTNPPATDGGADAAADAQQ
jgi:hypothetical protein